MPVAVTSRSHGARPHRLRGAAAAGVNAENEVVAHLEKGNQES
jgi:hypothetical protein